MKPWDGKESSMEIAERLGLYERHEGLVCWPEMDEDDAYERAKQREIDDEEQAAK